MVPSGPGRGRDREKELEFITISTWWLLWRSSRIASSPLPSPMERSLPSPAPYKAATPLLPRRPCNDDNAAPTSHAIPKAMTTLGRQIPQKTWFQKLTGWSKVERFVNLGLSTFGANLSEFQGSGRQETRLPVSPGDGETETSFGRGRRVSAGIRETRGRRGLTG